MKLSLSLEFEYCCPHCAGTWFVKDVYPADIYFVCPHCKEPGDISDIEYSKELRLNPAQVNNLGMLLSKIGSELQTVARTMQ